MSGLFGAKGPSPLAMLRGEMREKRKYKERAGFSGTMKQDKQGNWYKPRGQSSSTTLRRGFVGWKKAKVATPMELLGG